MDSSHWTSEFLSQAIFRMTESLERIEKCTYQLSFEELWKKPNESSNSVGILIQHLCGNINQYINSSLGNRPDSRQRDAEFQSSSTTAEHLLEDLYRTIKSAQEVIRTCPEKELMRIRLVQGFELSGIGIILHVVEHLSYHTGQIAFWTKILKDIDLAFYGGMDLNIKNEPDA